MSRYARVVTLRSGGFVRIVLDGNPLEFDLPERALLGLFVDSMDEQELRTCDGAIRAVPA